MSTKSDQHENLVIDIMTSYLNAWTKKPGVRSNPILHLDDKGALYFYAKKALSGYSTGVEIEIKLGKLSTDTEWYVNLLSLRSAFLESVAEGPINYAPLLIGPEFLAFFGKRLPPQFYNPRQRDKTLWRISCARDIQSMFEAYDMVAHTFGCVPVFIK